MNMKMVEKFNKMAESLQPQINSAFADRPMNTAKRRSQASQANLKGHQLKRAQLAMLALAQAWESGEVPPELEKVTSKAEILRITKHVTDYHFDGYHQMSYETDKLAYPDDPAAIALRSLTAKVKDDSQGVDPEAHKQKLWLSRVIHSKSIPGFFPTPQPAVDFMLVKAGLVLADVKNGEVDPTSVKPIRKDTSTLFFEPSCGSGAIFRRVVELFPEWDSTGIELNHDLVNYCNKTGLGDVTQADFLETNPEKHPSYDVILMNPPFEGGLDVKHVLHALKFLAPEGTIAAIMGAGVIFNSRSPYTQFRSLVEELGGEFHPMPANSFKESGTSVSSVLVTIKRYYP